MKKIKALTSIFSIVLVLALLMSGCSSAPIGAPQESAGVTASASDTAKPDKPKKTEKSEKSKKYAEDAKGDVIRVSTPKELLAALTPGEKTVLLAPGVYNISDPSVFNDRGSGYVRWEPVYDGYELILDGLDGVTLVGEDDVTITAEPRYANVLTLENTDRFTLRDITLGHTVEPGQCSGGVVELSRSRNVLIDDCDLYGCGIMGVSADNCSAVTVTDSEIHDCSWSAVVVGSCEDFRITDCDVHNCGSGSGSLFSASASVGFAVVNCEVENNSTDYFLSCDYSRSASILGCELEDNSFRTALFMIQGESPVVDGCSFSKNVFPAWYDSMNSSTPGAWAVSPDGAALDKNALEKMEHRDCTYDGYEVAVPEISLTKTVNADGLTEIHVKTVDELLAAVGSDTIIYLDSPMYDLSSASDYGWAARSTYKWQQCYDGFELIISGVEDMTIVGESAVISAVPRYANVLTFDRCGDMTLMGITAGHTEQPGECSGGVVYLSGCVDVTVDRCRLYGCGTVGISADNTDGITVVDSEICDCSYNGVSVVSSEAISFTRCSIHDCGRPHMYMGCWFTFDGKDYAPGSYNIENGLPTAPGSLCLAVGDRTFRPGDDGRAPVIELSSNSSPVTVSVKTASGDAFDASLGWWYVDGGIGYEVNGDGTLSLNPKKSSSGTLCSVVFGSDMGEAVLTVRIN